MLAGSLQPTDPTARGAHPQGHLVLGLAASLAGIEELAEKEKFRSCLLLGFQISRELLDELEFGIAIAAERLVGEFSHGV